MTDHDYEPVQATVIAKHFGRCPLCPYRIAPGDEIVSDEGTWNHADCFDSYDLKDETRFGGAA